MPNSGGSPPARTGGTGPARSSGVRPPLGLGRLRSRQRDWDKPRGSGRFKLDHPRCRFQPQHEDFRQHGTASLVRPFDVGDALPVQNRMLRPAVWPRTCKHFIITVSSGFCRHVGGRPHNRPLCYAWRQNMAGCLPRGRDTGLKLGLNPKHRTFEPCRQPRGFLCLSVHQRTPNRAAGPRVSQLVICACGPTWCR